MTESSTAVSPGFSGLRVVSFESRLAKEMTALIQKQGGVPLVAPSMREVPLTENAEAFAFGEELLAGRIDVLVLLTGVGTKTLVEALATRHPKEAVVAALGKTCLVARGPKPVRALAELGLKPAVAVPEPNTWRELLQSIDAKAPVKGKRVAVQEYGVPNPVLVAGLTERGADVRRVPVYRWALPEDVGPLREAVREIAAGRADVVLITTGTQIHHLVKMAELEGQADAVLRGLARAAVCSVGPVASEAIREHGIAVDLEPEHPKMGPLVSEASRRSGEIVRRKRAVSAVGGASAPRPAGPGRGTEAPPISTTDPCHNSLFLRACRREPTETTPIWLMRQAGRYMQEYRDLREKVPFLDLCKDPALCAEVTVTAVLRLGVDAAILFSDLLLPVEPMGLRLEYTKGDGPVIHDPVRTAADVDRVREIDPARDLAYIMDAVRQCRAALPAGVPLIGFAGAPFTLASYLIEGEGSKNYIHTKSLMRKDPGAWHALLGRIARAQGALLKAQVGAGAQAVQLFDSWVGCLSPADYREFVLPHSRTALAAVPAGIPTIHFGTQTGELLELMKEAGGTVIGIDWRVELDEARRRLGDAAVMGNLDPAVLFAPPDEIRAKAKRILDQAAPRPGHIFNLGHGVLPGTPFENVKALIDFVHEAGRR